MKILVTGATGLIGSELVELLLKKNHSINYLTTSEKKIVQKENYKGFLWNPSKKQIDINSIKDVDVIVHLAGASISKRWTTSYKKELLDSRVESSNLLFDLLQNNSHQVKQIVSASGTAIYPDSFSKIYTEDSQEIDTGFLGNVVVEWEKSVTQFETLGLKVSKLRTGIVFSNKGGALVEMVRPIRFFVGSGFGSGKQVQSWIHLSDVARLYLYVIENQISGTVNAVAPETISNQNLTKLIAKTINRPLFLPNIPQFVMQLILGEMSSLLFTNKNIIPQKALAAGFQFEFDTTQKALENILT